MPQTQVYLLIPTYVGQNDTVDAAYELATKVDPNGPIRFHPVDYPEPDPKEELRHVEEWDGKDDKTRPVQALSSPVYESDMFPSPKWRKRSLNIKAERKYLDVRESLLERMDSATEWFFETYEEDRSHCLVLLMNPYGNESNYFCGPSPQNRNAAFVQITHYATETTTARHIPIAYELFAAALRFRAFNRVDYESRFVHYEDKGCVNDFFQQIDNIRLKILTADLCEDCYKHAITQAHVDEAFMTHIYKGLDAIRSSQNNFTRMRRALSSLSIEITQRTVYFPEIDCRFKLSPKQMTLYKFYRAHPEGVAYHNLCDFRKEIEEIYKAHYTGEPDEMDETINAVLDNWCLQHEDLSQTVSKINRKLKDALGEQLSLDHKISGARRQPRRILDAANAA